MPRAQHDGAIQSGYTAVADYSGAGNQYLLVTATAEGVCTLSSAKTEDPIGVIWSNEGGLGGGLSLIPLKDNDVVPMVASAAISFGAEVTATAAGKIVTNDGTAGNRVLGTATEPSTADTQLIGIRISKSVQE